VNTMSKLHSGENGLQGIHENGRGFLMASARVKSQGIRDQKGAKSNYSNKTRARRQGESEGKEGGIPGGGGGGVSALLRTTDGTTTAGATKKVVRSTFGTRSSIIVGMTDSSLQAKKDVQKVCGIYVCVCCLATITYTSLTCTRALTRNTHTHTHPHHYTTPSRCRLYGLRRRQLMKD
jgi:hypothetical protein